MGLAPDELDERSTLRVVHALPGRLRLRVPAHVGGDDLVAMIRSLAGIQSCSWSPRTRGVLVLFDEHTISATAIIQEVARHFGFDLHFAQNPPLAQPENEVKPQASFAAGVAETLDELDRRLKGSTRGLLEIGRASCRERV